MSEDTFLKFPAGFLWGVGGSAYQIEGAVHEDGRGMSIWDTFSHTPGKTYQGHTGDVASDHYHRWAEDVAIMAKLGIRAYRFSIAWPRILPSGRGQVNSRGLDFYDRLVDALLDHGITPVPTLHHWDLPQALQDEGGWARREIVHDFAEYARIVGERLTDRATMWLTHNEPFVLTVLGHFTGEHAPGITDPSTAFKVGHHVLISHGLAVQALRAAARQPLSIGIPLDYSPTYPASDSDEDREAARRFDSLRNRMFIEPLLIGQYPSDMLALLGPFLPKVEDGDMALIGTPLDFIGLNYYSRSVIRHDPSVPIIAALQVQPPGNEYSMMWEIYPPGIYEMITRVWNDYKPKVLYITENGICVPDDVDADGQVRDYRRIRYLRDHLVQVHRAIQEGIPIQGYLVWSLLDNFEWALGYRMRFGLVYVDFETQKRTIKESARWYSQVIHDNGLDPTPGGPFLPC